MSGPAIYPSAEVVAIKHQSRPPPPPFQTTSFTTFVEQKVVIHLGDCQDIFFLSHALRLSPNNLLQVCLHLSLYRPPGSFSSFIVLLWYSFLKVACGENIVALSNKETHPVTGKKLQSSCLIQERGQKGRASGHY